jgi:hypothetical protein
MSDAGLLMCHSHAKVNTTMDNLLVKMANYDTRHLWDVNFESGKLVKEIGPMVQMHYLKTKKVAVVSSRDQYVVIYKKDIPA